MPPAKDPDGTGPETLNSFCDGQGSERDWDHLCGFGRVLSTIRFIRNNFTFRTPPPSSQMYEVHNTVPQIQFSTMGCYCLRFWSFSLYKPSRKYDWLIAPWAVYSSLWGCSRRSFHSTNIINGGVFADTQFSPFSVSSASWNVFPASFFGWSLMFAASVSLLSSSFEGIGFSVV